MVEIHLWWCTCAMCFGWATLINGTIAVFVLSSGVPCKASNQQVFIDASLS